MYLFMLEQTTNERPSAIKKAVVIAATEQQARWQHPKPFVDSETSWWKTNSVKSWADPKDVKVTLLGHPLQLGEIGDVLWVMR